MFELMRATQSTWMMRRARGKGLSKMTPFQRLALNAEVFRAHRCGPRQDGTLSITEDDKKYTLLCDPCGSGGRQRLGTRSMAPPPGSQTVQLRKNIKALLVELAPGGVPYYCIHCAVNELLMIEWGGRPLR